MNLRAWLYPTSADNTEELHMSTMGCFAQIYKYAHLATVIDIVVVKLSLHLILFHIV